jgi:hypothetical protein
MSVVTLKEIPIKPFKERNKQDVTRLLIGSPTLEEIITAATTPLEQECKGPDFDEKDRAAPEKMYRQDWYGNTSIEKSVEMIRRGWPEGTKSVRKLSEAISAPILRQARKVVHHDVCPGHWIDEDRYLRGEPEVWGEIVDSDELVDQVGGKFVHFVVNAGMSCAQCNSLNCTTEPVRIDTLRRRGAAICAAIDVLEAMGFRTRVTYLVLIETPNRGTNSTMMALRFPVKEYHDYLDMDALTFRLAHPAMMRRLVFAYFEHMDLATKRAFLFRGNSGTVGTYGLIRNNFPKELGLEDDGDAIVYIPSVTGNPGNFQSDANAERFCKDILAKQGIRFIS